MKKTSIYLILIIAFLSQILFAGDRMIELEKSYKIDEAQFKVNLDVDGAEVEITKNRELDRCYVFIAYPEDRCEVDIDFNKNREYLEINIDHEWLSGKDKQENDATRIIIELPQHPEISLTTEIKAGEIDFELGDLRIHDFELRNWAGDVTVSFNAPNLTEMQNLDVNVKIGEVKLYNLGNANFVEADINSGIGELNIDFRGERLKNSRAYIDLDVGETTVILPEEAGVKMKVSKFLFLSEFDYPNWFNRDGKYYFSENYNENNKNLNLSISTGIGEFKIKVK